ncbi:MAG: hypothetical protein U9O98_08195 [Asgard group archaeon]|nr:hypothetical protein [Asgard group archaeon]
MNNKNKKTKQEEIVNEFITEIERKLPFWLKSNENEKKEILEEIENHIWDKADVLAEGEEPTVADIQYIIENMGDPNKIADEYKRRGKPKFYITEELCPMYLKTLLFIGGILLGINLISMFVSIGSKPAGTLIQNTITGIIISLAIAAILITFQFVFLSMEGYLPEDFEKLLSPFGSAISGAFDKISSEKQEQQEAMKDSTTAPSTASTPIDIKAEPSAKMKAETSYEKTPAQKYSIPPQQQYHTRNRYYEEKNYQQWKKPPKHRKPPKRFTIYGQNYLSDGIFGMVFGIILMILPFLPLLDFLNEYLRYWIAIYGAVTFFAGLFHFTQALIGRREGLQILFLSLGFIPKGLKIWLFVSLIQNKSLLMNDLSNWITSFNIVLVAKIILWIAVAGIIISIIVDLVRMIRIGVEGFPEKYQ